ncbi:hypothetical protein AK88_02524 [Plasmodium fragile]|uniref:Uncharacterized protein n=1 Tax=Plasmodium fragile TaxID=5857 RepID=A0A0D9QLE5_PLAFR|nr:uncharacterized protein AK88_02524 [Plasmodium fragile]KJP87768.1 hypothetical protein AK88_02524 [Plasmodium fragile]
MSEKTLDRVVFHLRRNIFQNSAPTYATQSEAFLQSLPGVEFNKVFCDPTDLTKPVFLGCGFARLQVGTAGISFICSK